MRKRINLKNYIVLLIIVSGLLLTGCSSSDEEREQEIEEDSQVSQKIESVEEKADEEDLEVEKPKDDYIDHDSFEEPMQLKFLSGAGAWSTEIQLSSDGSFTGIYEDSNSGESGNGHLSTNYISEFTGQFVDIKKLDGETYSMKLLDINYEYEDKEWIENKTKYVTTEAYGFEEGKDFFLYSPKKNIRNLNEDLLSWVSGHGGYDNAKNELQYWVLHNEMTDYGFFSEKYFDEQESESKETALNNVERLPVNFEKIDFDNNYSGPGSEFIGIWHEDNSASVDFAPNPWEIYNKNGLFYIRAELPGDPRILIMTAVFEEGKLYSSNGTYVAFSDYENQSTFEIELPETIEPGEEESEFFMENSYLQWVSTEAGDLRDMLRGTQEDGAFKGYKKE